MYEGCNSALQRLVQSLSLFLVMDRGRRPLEMLCMSWAEPVVVTHSPSHSLSDGNCSSVASLIGWVHKPVQIEPFGLGKIHPQQDSIALVSGEKSVLNRPFGHLDTRWPPMSSAFLARVGEVPASASDARKVHFISTELIAVYPSHLTRDIS